MNQNDRDVWDDRTDKPEEPFVLMLPVYSIYRWLQLRKIKRDLNNIEKHYDFDVANHKEEEDRR